MFFSLDNGNDAPNDEIWFQQDGAPPHYARDVREYLDNVFFRRWIGRRGTIEWPPRSPDLTPLDYFLWGHLKNVVYKTKPNDLDDLKERIAIECRRIEESGILTNVLNVFEQYLAYCQEVNGQHFKHLI